MSNEKHTASELIANAIKNSPSTKAMVCSQVLVVDDGIDVTLPDICFSEKQLAFINSGDSREDRIRILITHRKLLTTLYQLENNPKKNLLYEKAFDLGYENSYNGVSGVQPFYEILIDLIL